jgi:tRNA-dihydrouridine synthase C
MNKIFPGATPDTKKLSGIKLHLAPMEGIMDFVFRDLITQGQTIDQCTTEFVRVTDKLIPDHVFYRYCPELKTNSRTRSGVPVFVQLLGGQMEPMAENASKLSQLRPAGIDLNFGCPAKTVNRHDGGACLLQNPERLFSITSAVRKAVPKEIPVTAKMRLGFENTALYLENAQALAAAGANKITIHARTKSDGYRAPARWEYIAKIKEQMKIPIIANGDIKNVESLLECQKITSCTEFMIGRGSLQNPIIFSQINQFCRSDMRPPKAPDSINQFETTMWSKTKALILPFFLANSDYTSPRFAQARTKQWLSLLALQFPEAQEIFNQIKIETSPDKFQSQLESHLQ